MNIIIKDLKTYLFLLKIFEEKGSEVCCTIYLFWCFIGIFHYYSVIIHNSILKIYLDVSTYVDKQPKKTYKSKKAHTRQRDGVFYPSPKTFTDAYKVIDIGSMPNKTRETSFQILSRIYSMDQQKRLSLRNSRQCLM